MLQWWWKWCKMQNNAVIFGGVTYFNYLDIFRIPKHGFFEKKFNFVQTIFVLSTKSTSKVHFWVNLVWKQQKIVFFAPDAWCMYWSWAILSYGLITKKTLYIYIYIYKHVDVFYVTVCVFMDHHEKHDGYHVNKCIHINILHPWPHDPRLWALSRGVYFTILLF